MQYAHQVPVNTHKYTKVIILIVCLWDAGTYQPPLMTTARSACQLCPPGSISDGSSGLQCLSCTNWPGTFASAYGQTLCRPKTVQCSSFNYVNVSLDPASDNTCTPCVSCDSNEMAVAYESATESLGLLSPADLSSYLSELCPGNTDSPLYRCISNTPVAGKFLSITQAVGAAVGSTGIDPYTFQTCSDALYDPSIVNWVAGPSIETCYVGCLYGVSLQGTLTYLAAFQNAASLFPQNVQGNIFLQQMLEFKEEVCLPCPLSECSLGYYRPDYGNGCGPPCALPTFQGCSNINNINNNNNNNHNNDGCIALCSNAPPNSGYMGGGLALGQNSCPWSCLLGWHLSDNRSSCEPCSVQNPAVLCNSTNYAVLSPQECMPWFTSLDLCKYCPPLPYARLTGWNQSSSACEYQCYSGYFLFNSSSCLPCNAVWLKNMTICPVGMFLDDSICTVQGLAPACRPCATSPGIILITNGIMPNNATQCRAMCQQGFHTVQVSTGAYMSILTQNLAAFPTFNDILCIPCTPNDGRSCFNTSTCFPNYFRNLSVADGQPHSCVACKQSSQCNAGYYAPICTGTTFNDSSCIACDSALIVNTNQQFIAYSAALQGPNKERVILDDNGACPRACLNNYVQAQDNPAQCVSCKSLASADTGCIQSGVQPPLCAFVYAYWNAVPGVVWWDAQHAPPYLQPFTTQPISRAGICWACPIGTATLADSMDLCVALPGYTSSNILLPSAKLPIPSLPSDVYLVMQRPKMPLLQVKSSLGRRLLLSTASTTTTSSADMVMVVPCPFGSYKSSNGDGACYVCPQGSSTISVASPSMAVCMCQYGYYLHSKQGPCQPCPANTFQNVSISVLQAPTSCISCPANQSTLGAIGATRCTCALGFVPLLLPNKEELACVLCPAGYYCPPCTTADDICPPQQQECFPDSTSPPGSYDVSNCTCNEGFVGASRPNDPTAFYCTALPLGAWVNPQNGQMQCLPGKFFGLEPIYVFGPY